MKKLYLAIITALFLGTVPKLLLSTDNPVYGFPKYKKYNYKNKNTKMETKNLKTGKSNKLKSVREYFDLYKDGISKKSFVSYYDPMMSAYYSGYLVNRTRDNTKKSNHTTTEDTESRQLKSSRSDSSGGSINDTDTYIVYYWNEQNESSRNNKCNKSRGSSSSTRSRPFSRKNGSYKHHYPKRSIPDRSGSPPAFRNYSGHGTKYPKFNKR